MQVPRAQGEAMLRQMSQMGVQPQSFIIFLIMGGKVPKTRRWKLQHRVSSSRKEAPKIECTVVIYEEVFGFLSMLINSITKHVSWL